MDSTFFTEALNLENDIETMTVDSILEDVRISDEVIMDMMPDRDLETAREELKQIGLL